VTTPARTVEVVSVWAADSFGGTFTQYATIQPLLASLGRGAVMGTATLEARWGKRSVPAGTPAAPSTIDPATVEIPIGYAVELRMGDPLSAIWHGFVTAHRPNPQAQSTIIECIEARAMLSYAYCLHGDELNAGSGTCLTGTMPAFNDRPGGDRSTAGPPYFFDRATDGSGNRWTAAQAAQNLTSFIWTQAVPLTVPSSQTTVAWLGSTDREIGRIATHGRTIADALCLIWPEDEGYTWRQVDVASNILTVQALDIANPTGAQDIDLDAGEPWIRLQNIRREIGYAVVHGSGGRARVGLSLAWDATGGACALEPYGWTPGTAADTAIDEADPDKPWDGPEWRRWKIKADWDGTQYGSASAGIRRVSAASGARAWPSDPNDLPTGESIELDRQLPCGEGFTASVEGGRQRPVVIMGDGTEYEDVSTLGITIESPGVILIGSKPADAQRLRDTIGTAGELIVTLGIIEPDPLERWTTVPGTWANGRPEVVHLDRQNLEQWLVPIGTVTGVDDDGTLLTLGADVEPRNDQSTLNDVVTDAAARLAVPTLTAAWEDRGIIDASSLPGDRIASITSGGRTWTGHGVVARVTWRFRLEEYGTTVEVEPVRGSVARA
jgi:hypothetical protein